MSHFWKVIVTLASFIFSAVIHSGQFPWKENFSPLILKKFLPCFMFSSPNYPPFPSMHSQKVMRSFTQSSLCIQTSETTRQMRLERGHHAFLKSRMSLSALWDQKYSLKSNCVNWETPTDTVGVPQAKQSIWADNGIPQKHGSRRQKPWGS